MSQAPADPPAADRPAPGPVPSGERIRAMDAARGFALLGILFVNIIAFSEPFGKFIEPVPGDVSLADKAAFYFTKVFCEGKFYPLFFLLFGAGLIMQSERARARGRPFWPIGLRRMVVLGVIGLLHAFLLWYGDILFVYALVGLLLLALHRARPRTLTIVGATLLFMAALLSTGFMLLMTLSPKPPQAAALTDSPAPDASQPAPSLAGDAPADPAPETEREAQIREVLENNHPEPFTRLMRSFEQGALFEDAGKRGISPMTHPVWLDAETEAYAEGPWLQAAAFRGMTYAMILLFVIFGFGWSVIAMVFFGAALAKWGAFAPERGALHRRFAVIGLGVGLPLSIVAAATPATLGVTTASVLLWVPAQVLATPLMALGYFGLISLLVARGAASPLFRALGAAGRMAFTCYLLETVLATLVFYHYGLGLFGSLSRAQTAGVVVAIYACVVALSVVWLRHFRYGPMEWVWRSLTYLKAQPMRRERGVRAA